MAYRFKWNYNVAVVYPDATYKNTYKRFGCIARFVRQVFLARGKVTPELVKVERIEPSTGVRATMHRIENGKRTDGQAPFLGWLVGDV